MQSCLDMLQSQPSHAWQRRHPERTARDPGRVQGPVRRHLWARRRAAAAGPGAARQRPGGPRHKADLGSAEADPCCSAAPCARSGPAPGCGSAPSALTEHVIQSVLTPLVILPSCMASPLDPLYAAAVFVSVIGGSRARTAEQAFQRVYRQGQEVPLWAFAGAPLPAPGRAGWLDTQMPSRCAAEVCVPPPCWHPLVDASCSIALWPLAAGCHLIYVCTYIYICPLA